MRTPAIVASLLLALACGVSAGGCQVIAGLTVLEITTSTGSSGGAGGSGGIGGISTTISASSTGGACSSDCANGEPCPNNGTCQSEFCANSGGGSALGICAAKKVSGIGCTAKVECKSGYCTDGVCCNVADCANECLSCSASTNGTCKSTIGLLCGVKTATSCSAADTCDAVGNCLLNHAVVNTPCGAACNDAAVVTSLCDGAGKCSGQQTLPCGGNFSCNPMTTACNTSCAAGSECVSTAFCALGKSICAPCGVFPPDAGMCTPGQGGCETCDMPSNNTCVTTCDIVNECILGMPTKIVSATKGPARLVCKDQCNGLNVMCQGPYPCEVVCESGGCVGLTLTCGPDGPCKITCQGTGCAGAGATMNCGDNLCEATCAAGGSKVTQSCASSCGCSKGTCL